MKMVERDLAHHRYKETNQLEDLREYCNIKNNVNQMIAKEKFNRNMASYQGESVKLTDKWKKVLKKDTGQAKFTSPQTIIENNVHHTTHKDMSEALNHQYVTNIRKY